MPLVTAAFLALVGALLAAFAGAATATLGACATAAAVALVRRDARLAGLALTAAAGALLALGSMREEDACRRRAERVTVHRVVVEQAVRPGGFTRARVLGAGCALHASLAVRAGRAEAGAHVLVRGEVHPTERGLRIREGVLVPLHARDGLIAWRARVGRWIDRAWGADAPLVRALVVADAAGIDPAVRARYADAGLVHALSVSGLHVAIVAGALELLLRAARLPRPLASAGAVAAVGAYVLFIGAPAPAVRAGAMLAVEALARALQRPTSPWAVFALGAATPLVEPSVVLDLGYQLSVAGMGALVAGRALARRLRAAVAARRDARARGGLRHRHLVDAVARELVVGTLATLVTAPLVAWHFGQVSAVGPLANVAAGPLLTLLQPMLFLGVVLAPLGDAGAFVADATRPLLALFDRVAAAAASVPGAVVESSPTLVEMALAALAALALIVAASSRRPAAGLLAATACTALLAWSPALPLATGGMAELHVLDVGQGDAVALRTPRGRWVLVDAGRAWRGGDAGHRVVVPYVRRRGGELAALVLSHPHADHVGGAASVLRRLGAGVIWDAAFVLGSEVYADALREARRRRVPWRRVRPGDSLTLDGVALRVLAPDSAWTAALDDPNLASVVLSVQFGRVRFLLVGDAEAPEERWLLDRAGRDPALAAALRADVLKVGHHGSRTSSTPEFVRVVAPRLALVSVGAGNSYGHPSAAVLHRLRRAGAEVLRTDRHGTLVVRTDGRRIRVEAGGERWTVGERPGGAGRRGPADEPVSGVAGGGC